MTVAAYAWRELLVCIARMQTDVLCAHIFVLALYTNNVCSDYTAALEKNRNENIDIEDIDTFVFVTMKGNVLAS